MKTLVVFDLDGTLAESKSSIDIEMTKLLDSLLRIVKVAIISGAAWQQFKEQILAHLPQSDGLKNLSLLPTCGTTFYKYESGWRQLYSENFTAIQREKIIEALQQVTNASERTLESVWGEVIEDRGSQITFSALGQEAPTASTRATAYGNCGTSLVSRLIR